MEKVKLFSMSNINHIVNCLSWFLSWLSVGSSWKVMAHGDAREGKWWGNWQMEWVAITFKTTSEHDLSSITTADVHNSAASSRLNWRPSQFKWTLPFHRKMKSDFCACAITFKRIYLCDCLEVLNNVWECVRCHCFTINGVRICSLTLQWSFSMSCMCSVWIIITYKEAVHILLHQAVQKVHCLMCPSTVDSTSWSAPPEEYLLQNMT